jgi:long-chain fatty acid transport protein
MLRGRSLGQAIGVVALVGATFGVSTASAQVDYEIMASLQFNFSNPGARSLAMAGALTGAGDDATGAWTNPGGLTNITRPEVGVEFRGFDFKTPFVSAGRFNGATQGGVDNVDGLVYGNSEDSTHSLSFVSAVVPKSRFAFAFYRTEVANFATNLATEGAFYEERGSQSRAFPFAGNLELKIANFGGSAAVRLTDQVSVGVGVSLYDFELDSRGARFLFLRTPLTDPGFFLGPAIRDDRSILAGGNRISEEFITGEDTAVGINIGASINPSDKVRIGASFRQGPKFDISYERFNRFDERVCLSTPTCDGPADSEFRVPDVLAVGVLVKPLDALNIAADFRRVRYSQLTQNMALGFDDPDDDFDVSIDDYVLDDGNEIRVAGEYLFTNLPSPLSAIAIRGGVWRDPDHRIRYEGPFSTDTVLYPAGESEMHYTGGAGVVFDKVQFDFGFDRSETVKTFSLSAVLRF